MSGLDGERRRNSQSSTNTTTTTTNASVMQEKKERAATFQSGDDRETSSAGAMKGRAFTMGAMGAEDEFQEASFGKCSVFDICVLSKDTLPFELPVASYLEEVLIGLNCSPDLPSHEKKIADEDAPAMRANYNRLRRLTSTTALRESCVALFWIAVGVVTSRVMPEVIAELRGVLAQNWCLVNLDVNQQVHRDVDARDFLLSALPAILVQAIYRLLVDGFNEDKPQFVHHVDALLEKLSHIVSYEVCGFQLNVETSLKERKQLFRRALLENPFVNQRDSVKAQMRQDLLENRAKGALPLTFGTHFQEGGQPLEETQLEHVMLNHEEKLRPDIKLYDGESPAPTPVPQALSVERYAGIAMEGNDLFTRQLMELAPEMYRPQTPPSRSSSKQAAPAPLDFDLDDEDWGSSPSNASRKYTGSPTPQKNSSPTQRMRVTLKKQMSAMNILNSKRAKDAEQAEKRRREDLLAKRISKDPLPPEFRERSLDTSWVSPIMNRLAAGERDRQALRKPASEAYQLKMAVPKQKILPDLVSRSRSAPELRLTTRFGNQELPKLSRTGPISGGGGDETEGGSTSSSPLSATKSSMQKDLKAASCFGSSHKVLRLAVAEDLILEPPPRLQNDVVMHRLEAASDTAKLNSFGNWAKEHDITSGNKKQRMDEAAVRKAETSYVKSLQDLVGPPERPALKMFESPVQMAKRRSRGHKAVASGGSPHGGGRRHRINSSHSNCSD